MEPGPAASAPPKAEPAAAPEPELPPDEAIHPRRGAIRLDQAFSIEDDSAIGFGDLNEAERRAAAEGRTASRAFTIIPPKKLPAVPPEEEGAKERPPRKVPWWRAAGEHPEGAPLRRLALRLDEKSGGRIYAHKWSIAACLGVLGIVAIGLPLGFAAGWGAASGGPSGAPAYVEEQVTVDLDRRNANVASRYEELGIDMDAMDRVPAGEIQPITVDPVTVEPAAELARLADVDVSEGTGIKLDVPIVNQLDTSDGGRSLMSGCEIASLAMLLRYSGVDVTKEELQDATPTVPVTGDDGLYGNPNRAFVGDMAGRSSGVVGYSVYHQPIAELAQRYLMNRPFEVVDLTGQSFTALLKELADGNPCWVITTTSMQPDLLAETWETAEGPVVVNWALHSVAVTGYDDEHIYINDPYGYTQNVPYDRDGFEQAWKLMGSQAVVIVPVG